MVPSCFTAFGKIVDPTDVPLSLSVSLLFLSEILDDASKYAHIHTSDQRLEVSGLWHQADTLLHLFLDTELTRTQ